MAEVHVTRYSLNKNIKSFQNLLLPERFSIRQSNGDMTEYTFKNIYGQPEGFDIGNGGIIKLNSESAIDAHNIASLKVLEKHQHLMPPNCFFKVVDLDENNKIEQQNRNLRIDALLAIRASKDKPGFIGSVARRLGMPGLALMTASEVQNKVEALAENQPAEVLEIINHHYQTEMFEIDKAKEAKIITQQNGFYYYGQVMLGIHEADLINFFKAHPDIYDQIKRRNQQVYGVSDSPTSPLAEAMLARFNAPIPPIGSGTGSAQEILASSGPVAQVDSTAFFQDGPAALDESTIKLIDEARIGGVITESYGDDEGDEILFFNTIPLTDNQPGTREDKAARMLAHPANQGVVKNINKALDKINPARKEKV